MLNFLLYIDLKKKKKLKKINIFKNEFDSTKINIFNQEIERMRSYVYTIQRSINETHATSQTLKHDLEIFRNHQETSDMKFDYDQLLNQCLEKSNEIQYEILFEHCCCICRIFLEHDYLV